MFTRRFDLTDAWLINICFRGGWVGGRQRSRNIMYSASWIEFQEKMCLELSISLSSCFSLCFCSPHLFFIFPILTFFSGSTVQNGVLYGKLEMLRCTRSLAGYTDHFFLKSEFPVHLKLWLGMFMGIFQILEQREDVNVYKFRIVQQEFTVQFSWNWTTHHSDSFS